MTSIKASKMFTEIAKANYKTANEGKILQWQTSQFESGCHGDLTIQCGRKKWNVHQIIVCAQSSFFEKACEKNFQEGFSGIVNLPDDEPETMYVMLRYMYARDYSDGSENIQPRNANKNPALAFNASMYALADKYDVKLLKVLAEDKFAAALDRSQVAHIPDLVNAIKIVYTTTLSSDRCLRDCLKPIFKRCRDELFHTQSFMDLFKNGFADGELAMDTIRAWVDFSDEGEQVPWARTYCCANCLLQPDETFDVITCEQCGILTYRDN